MLKIEIEFSEAAQRLDVFCTSVSEHSRTKIAQMIKEGLILVNDAISKPSYKLEVDDVVSIDKFLPKPLQLEPVEMDLDILYEDDDVLVINKPKGLVVHPGAGTKEATLVSGLLAHTKQLSNDDIRPGIVHRLDKDTSGLLVVAKNDVAHAFLADQLKDKTMHREYLAIVTGNFPHIKAKVDAPIGRDQRNRQQMAVTEKNSKPAITYLNRLETIGHCTLLSCQLETGRTHQIRVHCQYIGYPVLGDPLYGLKKQSDPYGQYLHAYKLSFEHPKTKELMTFECEPPQIFKDKIESLKRGES
ncbi:MAG: RluA family pseudouridine synthase [Erysipelothrix sp.]|nr:RluA family pseudouridine synthase [Erysipelothrix sp.]